MDGIFVDAAQLSPDVASNPAMTTFIKDGKMDVGNVVKSYLEAQTLIGKKGMPLPADENDNEGWNRVFDTLGRPKTADEYKFPELAELNAPEGFKVSDELTKGFRAWAHKAGLNSKQAAMLYKEFMASQIGEFNRLAQEKNDVRSAAETGLRTKYGAAYEQKIANVGKLLKAFADQEDAKYFTEGAGNDPRFVRLLSKIAEKMGEDGILGTRQPGFTLSPQEAQAEISKINNDKAHPYWDAAHLEHAAAVIRMADLLKMASGQAA